MNAGNGGGNAGRRSGNVGNLGENAGNVGIVRNGVRMRGIWVGMG